jgi:hypothetical protein
MKIKEKGLTGKAADMRRDNMSFRKFNAFRLSPKDQAALAAASGSGGAKPPTEIFLEYLGAKILIQRDAEGKGFLKEEEIPYMEGASLKFEGAGPGLAWDEIKVGPCAPATPTFRHIIGSLLTHSLRRDQLKTSSKVARPSSNITAAIRQVSSGSTNPSMKRRSPKLRRLSKLSTARRLFGRS